MAVIVAQSQSPAASLDSAALRLYSGVYQWSPTAYIYLQPWEELTGFGKPMLVAFDESGDVRTLYPGGGDEFTTGPGMGVPEPVESRVQFQRDTSGHIVSLSWRRAEAPPRIAKRMAIEKQEDVRFVSGSLQLAGTVTTPLNGGRHPAIILVHGSGAESRDHLLPYAHFLVRHGFVVFGYDKRGVGASTGDWNMATLEDLAGDVIAAFDYLKTRPDIEPRQIGLLGISQAGWIMPIAAVRAKGLAFIINISGAGVPVWETTLDQARNEMTMTRMPANTVEQIIALLRLQYDYARTGQGWDAYAAARSALAARMGPPPDTIPGAPDAPYWGFIRRTYFFDPTSTLRQLKTPTLAIWGELDNNIIANKNKAAWDAAMATSGNRDYTGVILQKADHAQYEANTGSNAEMKTLSRFVPAYRTTVEGWLAKRIRGFK
jgi:pimeloyl-ACP methyl ester carboxylesterase